MSSEIHGWKLEWKSDRFKKELTDLNTNSVLYDDDDPRIVLTTDNKGEACWIIGYTPTIQLSHPFTETPPRDHVGGYVIVLRVRDYSVNYVPQENFKKDQTQK